MSFSIKIEPEEDKSDNEGEADLVIDDDHEDEEPEKIKNEIPPAPRMLMGSLPNNSAAMSSLLSAMTPRRCETCDIKFTYQKSYMAHKEFYCKERNNNGTTGAATAAVGAVNSKSSASGDGMTSPSNGIQSTVTNSRAAEVQ